jgi:hypothetical protein
VCALAFRPTEARPFGESGPHLGQRRVSDGYARFFALSYLHLRRTPTWWNCFAGTETASSGKRAPVAR